MDFYTPYLIVPLIIILIITTFIIISIKSYEGKRYEISGYVLLMISLYLPFGIYIFWKEKRNSSNIEKLAQTGDYLGGTTVGVLTVASIFFLIATIRLQQKNIKYQEEELDRGNSLSEMHYFESNFQFLLKTLNENKLKIQDEALVNNGTSEKTYYQEKAIELYWKGLINAYRIQMLKQFYLDLYNKDRKSFKDAVENLKYFLEKIFLVGTDPYNNAVRNLSNFEDVLSNYSSSQFLYNNAFKKKSEVLIEFTVLEGIITELENQKNNKTYNDDVTSKIQDNMIYKEFKEVFIGSKKYRIMAVEYLTKESKHHYSIETYFKTLEVFIEFFYHSKEFSDLSEKRKKYYFKMLNIQLSKEEKTILWNRINLLDEYYIQEIKSNDFLTQSDILKESPIPF